MKNAPSMPGADTNGALSNGRYAPRDLNFVSAAHSPLKRSDFAQALIDVFAVTFGILFLCSVACSLPLAIFIMFFVGS